VTEEKKSPNERVNLTAYWLAVASLLPASTRQVTHDVGKSCRVLAVQTSWRSRGSSAVVFQASAAQTSHDLSGIRRDV